MAVLRVGVVPGPGSADVARRLRERDEGGLLDIVLAGQPAGAALVIGVGEAAGGEGVADVFLDAAAPVLAQADRLWAERLAPFAQNMAGTAPEAPGSPVLQDHDPRFPIAARRLLGRLRAEFIRHGLDDGRWTYDHIGSTAVPGLRAKRFIDLQIGAVPVSAEGSAADGVLSAAGYRPTRGARPDSPGVYWDHVKDPALAPADAYRKRLFVRPDPAMPGILHIRLLGSPWWSYTVAFRDWLRADPAGRRAYEAAKDKAARDHAADADFDDYTRAKGAFFDDVQHLYERAAARPRLGEDSSGR